MRPGPQQSYLSQEVHNLRMNPSGLITVEPDSNTRSNGCHRRPSSHGQREWYEGSAFAHEDPQDTGAPAGVRDTGLYVRGPSPRFRLATQ